LYTDATIPFVAGQRAVQPTSSLLLESSDEQVLLWPHALQKVLAEAELPLTIATLAITKIAPTNLWVNRIKSRTRNTRKGVTRKNSAVRGFFGHYTSIAHWVSWNIWDYKRVRERVPTISSTEAWVERREGYIHPTGPMRRVG
jgi:nicotinamide mononucleotide adenylyltransferase